MTIRRLSVLPLVMLVALAACGGGRKPAPVDNEFAQMRREAGLSAEQEIAFTAKVAGRDAAVRAWNDGPEGRRLQAARTERSAATDPAAQAALDAEIQRLNQAQWAMRRAYRSEVVQVLDDDQQRRWAGGRLSERLTQGYARLDLADEQRARIHAIAGAAAARQLAAGDVARDPYLATVLEPARVDAAGQIEAEVLTDAQRAALAEWRAAVRAQAAARRGAEASEPAP